MTFSLDDWAILVGIPIPELCFTAYSKGYATERVAEAYSEDLIKKQIMKVDYKICDAPPYHTVLKNVVALTEKDGGYGTPSVSADMLRRLCKDKQWSLLSILDGQEGQIFMCIWKLTMRHHNKREY